MSLTTSDARTSGGSAPFGSPPARAAGPATAVFRASGGAAGEAPAPDPRPLPWLLGSIGAAAAVALGGWLLVLAPQDAATDALKDQAVQAGDDEAQLTTRVAELKAQFSDLPQYQADLARVRTQIPTDPQLSELVRALRDAAAATGATLTSVVPAAPVPATSPTAGAGVAVVEATAPAAAAATPATTAAAGATVPATTTATTTDPATGLVRVPLTLTASGSYAAVEAFLAAVQQQDRLVLLSTVALAPGSGEGGVPVVTLTASGSVFALPATGAEVAAGATAGSLPTSLPTSVPTAAATS